MQATAGGGTHDTQPTGTYMTTKKPQCEASPLEQRRGQSDPNDISHPLPCRTHHGRDHDTYCADGCTVIKADYGLTRHSHNSAGWLILSNLAYPLALLYSNQSELSSPWRDLGAQHVPRSFLWVQGSQLSWTLYFTAFNFLLWTSHDCGILHMMWTDSRD